LKDLSTRQKNKYYIKALLAGRMLKLGYRLRQGSQ
jgi:hypothetical protein